VCLCVVCVLQLCVVFVCDLDDHFLARSVLGMTNGIRLVKRG